MSEDLKLLVEWSDPWQEFVSSIRPALSRSPLPLAGEAPTGLRPYRGILVSWAVEAGLLAAAIILSVELPGLRPYAPPHLPTYDVIYFSADELPQTPDQGGAQSGRTGRGGGQQARHRTQIIRVVRGNRVVEKVVDAPDLNLPIASDAVKNLLALKHVPGPPPAEGLKSSVSVSALRDPIVAPPPQVLAKFNRNSPSLQDQVIAPPPDPSENRKRSPAEINASVVAPPPSQITDSQSHAIVVMSTPIVLPAPSDPQRELPPLRAPVSEASNVVPPPVSAPHGAESQNPRLALPAPVVVAPPPSQISRDARTLSGAGLGDPQKVVAPPVQVGNTPQKAVHGLLGTANIVPPPPSLAGGTSASSLESVPGGTLAGNVVPPPPSVAAGTSSSSGRARGKSPALGEGSVIPPPPSTASLGGSPSGHGTGSKGAGFGGLSDAGSVLAPPSSGGTGGGKGIIVSSKPGSTEGAPKNGGAGTIAMSPSGGDKPGLGGAGGGAGVVHGTGPGSGFTGEGPGGGREGGGKGSGPEARGGISPYPGSGGSGAGVPGQVPGVSVQGGSTVALPSFGSAGNEPSSPERSGSGKAAGDFAVTVEGSSRAGGAFARYGELQGTNYSIFMQTAAGPAELQYADPASVSHPYRGRITEPVPIRKELPQGLAHVRMAFACDLDRAGVLHNIRVVEGPPAVTSQVQTALASWKFVPAKLGEQPIEVSAFLGFNIDTR
ncbi:MAG TPA: hypothetical protein VEI01_01375 [Terriglobales bacterium]|nr:hypothetical protein [Terriglobales bacterium]